VTSAAELARVATPVFARHETFHPRYGWLRKAFEAPADGPDVFSRPEATVLLGVGKNMVHAIRYWGLAYKILAEAPNPGHPRRPGVATTAFGDILLSEDGWDPYLEQSGTLWLLHWQLLAAPCAAPVWWATFHALEAAPMDDADLLDRVVEVIGAVPGWPRVASGSVKKDVDCLLRMYARRSGGRLGVEDLLDCPFRELGLLQPVAGEPRSYRFVVGPKPTLPDAVVAYASLDFAARTSPGSNTVTVARLAQEPGSPGRAFRIPATTIAAALERVALTDKRVKVANPAGSPQLLFDGDPAMAALELLSRYYLGATGSTRSLPGVDGAAPCRPARRGKPTKAAAR
jgi:hypothetical protein